MELFLVFFLSKLPMLLYLTFFILLSSHLSSVNGQTNEVSEDLEALIKKAALQFNIGKILLTASRQFKVPELRVAGKWLMQS